MKRIINIIALSVVFSAATAQSATRPVTLDQITTRVSSQNYYVQQNAERVYQAKQSIQLARRNLLPKLNLWRIIETPFSARGLLGLVGDIAPFLVPNNWLRVQEEKLFAQASFYGYQSLWANELLTARGLLLQASLEERLLEGVEQNRIDLEDVLELVRSREQLGSIPPGSSAQFEIQVLAAREELQNLKRVVQENRSQLAYILGYPGNDEAVPAGIQYVSSTEKNNLRYSDYENRVLSYSPESKQFYTLMIAAQSVKKERYFTFLGSNGLSRGTGGGIFDALPFQDGLGFGLAPSVRIVKSESRILGLRKQAVDETLRKDLKVLIESHNLDLTSRDDATRRLMLAQTSFQSLEDRMRLGEIIDGVELVQASQARMEALAAYHAIEVRLLLNLDRLKRMTFSDAYSRVPQ